VGRHRKERRRQEGGESRRSLFRLIRGRKPRPCEAWGARARFLCSARLLRRSLSTSLLRMCQVFWNQRGVTARAGSGPAERQREGAGLFWSWSKGGRVMRVGDIPGRHDLFILSTSSNPRRRGGGELHANSFADAFLLCAPKRQRDNQGTASHEESRQNPGKTPVSKKSVGNQINNQQRKAPRRGFLGKGQAPLGTRLALSRPGCSGRVG